MNTVQVEQKIYEMPPREGFTVAHFLTVADIDRSARFYEKVFGGYFRTMARGRQHKRGSRKKLSLPILLSRDPAIHRAASAEAPEMRGKAASKFAPEMKKNRAIAAPACAPLGMDAFTRAQYEWGDVRS